jgi:hypothetical protein
MGVRFPPDPQSTSKEEEMSKIYLTVSFVRAIRMALNKVVRHLEYQSFLKNYRIVDSKRYYERTPKEKENSDRLRAVVTEHIKKELIDSFLHEQFDPRKSKTQPGFYRKSALPVISRFMKAFKRVVLEIMPEYAVLIARRQDLENDFRNFAEERILPIVFRHFHGRVV